MPCCYGSRRQAVQPGSAPAAINQVDGGRKKGETRLAPTTTLKTSEFSQNSEVFFISRFYFTALSKTSRIVPNLI
jgi:hypothetical protein